MIEIMLETILPSCKTRERGKPSTLLCPDVLAPFLHEIEIIIQSLVVSRRIGAGYREI